MTQQFHLEIKLKICNLLMTTDIWVELCDAYSDRNPGYQKLN
jgi:hypothetical protein